MPSIPGTEETIPGRFLDLANLLHPNYGVEADGVTDDSAGINEWLEYLETSGRRGQWPAGIYGTAQDIDFPPVIIDCDGVGGPREVAGTTLDRGTVLKWVGGTAPTVAVATCNLLGEHGTVLDLKINGLHIDANGQPIAASFLGLGNGCELDILCEQFSSRGLVLGRAAGLNECEEVRVRALLVGMEGSRAFAANYLNDSNLNIVVRSALGETGPLARGIDIGQFVQGNIFAKADIEDCEIPIDYGTAVGGDNTRNFFNGVRLANPTHAPVAATVGAFTGTLGFVIRSNATPNEKIMVAGLSDETGFDRAFFSNETGFYIVGSVGLFQGLFTDSEIVGGVATEIEETSGPTVLSIAGVADGEFLKRVGTEIQGAAANDEKVAVYHNGVLVATRKLDLIDNPLAAFQVTDNAVDDTAEIEVQTLSETFEGVRAYRTTAMAIPNATTTAMLWDAESYDISGMHSIATATERFVAQVDGYYRCKMQVQWPANSGTGQTQAQIRKGASTAGYNDDVTPDPAGYFQTVEAIVHLVPGQYVDGAVFQNTGATLNIPAGESSTFMEVSLLRAPTFARGASLYRDTTDIVIPTATEVAVSWNNSSVVFPSYWELATPTRFVIPAGMGGVYGFNGQFWWDPAGGSGTIRRFSIRKNGVDILFLTEAPVAGTASYQLASGAFEVAAGDYVEVLAYQNSGGSVNLKAGSAWNTLFSAFRLGSV